MSLVTRFVPEPSLEERRAALIAASKLALARGVTSVVDFGRFSPGKTAQQAWDDFNGVWMWAEPTRTMCVRISAFLPLETWSAVAALVEQRRSPVSHWLHVGGVKTFADGSLGSGSALFHEMITPIIGFMSWIMTGFLNLSWKQTMLDIRLSMPGIFQVGHLDILEQGVSLLLCKCKHLQPYHLVLYIFLAKVSPLDPLRGIQAAMRRTPNGWQLPWIPFEIK